LALLGWRIILLKLIPSKLKENFFLLLFMKYFIYYFPNLARKKLFLWKKEWVMCFGV